ncbi:MAG TPA: Gfo/Idh/MocA family oxidoreductase [Coxiellaceae bacterium]|nr:MAG: LmbZ [Gammaproteobacteria bacterium RIFCSPHIGHO2_12_FULL_36_30]HLB55900.1 Gfo/Idh/MocA family oxidoreductase [Coxiellaceae bacterium]
MKIAIIGCGLIGQKRANAIHALNNDANLIACVDVNIVRANQLASHYANCSAYDNHIEMLEKSKPDVVIIATTHESLAILCEDVIKAGKHVFLEKPGARNSAEISHLIKLAEKYDVRVGLGFNHRHHRAFQKAKEIINQGAIGELMFIRARYGHGGRIGYEKEWRANPILSGGGELIDQGVHLIDLSRWFLGEFTNVQGFSHTYYWNMPVEDNGFLLLKTAKKQVAFLHASCTEWKNTFSFEIYGRDGKLHVNGLGGSYGTETLSYYKMLPEMGPPETIVYEYPMADNSWTLDIENFLNDIKKNQFVSPNLHDAFQALIIVEKIYQESSHDCYA